MRLMQRGYEVQKLSNSSAQKKAAASIEAARAAAKIATESPSATAPSDVRVAMGGSPRSAPPPPHRRAPVQVMLIHELSPLCLWMQCICSDGSLSSRGVEVNSMLCVDFQQ